jgi:hypothetical protein
MKLTRGQTADHRRLAFAASDLVDDEEEQARRHRIALLAWLSCLPSVEYSQPEMTEICKLRKITVARLRHDEDTTRLLRNGDYYLGVARADTSLRERLLLRAWDLHRHDDFGAAWASHGRGNLMVTKSMMEFCGVQVVEATDAQALYQKLYPHDDLEEMLPKADAVISHVVEVVAHLSPTDEEITVTKSLEPRPHTMNSKGVGTRASKRVTGKKSPPGHKGKK